ncbi:hypothetical protein VNO78_01624 [Psophocarpus tetragonolobus]|uniref:Uncharacterized protein n=1 Tax=Psophocarpus tetragonolobus TaxID=3891 RepID=A0AAN9TAJ8_PSOTE
MKKRNSPEKKKDVVAAEKPLATMPPPPKLERKPSIDTEPKTLLHGELDVAREAALKIINSHTKEEALKIFLTGLVPAGTSSKQVKEDVLPSDCDDDEDE